MGEEHNSLELLIQHERAIGRLYALFAEVFPEHREFWEQVRDEEQRHADCLQGLSSKESLKQWFATNSQFKRLSIRGSLEYLARQMERIKMGPISLLEALSIAGDLEEALIEKQFISLNVSGPEEIKSVMKTLVSDTQRHRRMIAEKLNVHKRETR